MSVRAKNLGKTMYQIVKAIFDNNKEILAILRCPFCGNIDINHKSRETKSLADVKSIYCTNCNFKRFLKEVS